MCNAESTQIQHITIGLYGYRLGLHTFFNFDDSRLQASGLRDGLMTDMRMCVDATALKLSLIKPPGTSSMGLSKVFLRHIATERAREHQNFITGPHFSAWPAQWRYALLPPDARVFSSMCVQFYCLKELSSVSTSPSVTAENAI
jgi:hypothetical protein